MTYVIVVTGSEADQPDAHGPYKSHAAANHDMQVMYDKACEEFNPDESDDSDASHFYITMNEESQMDWFIVELQPS